MNKIEVFLQNLNPREKFLFISFICLCALFLAFKIHDHFLEDIFQKTLVEYNYLALNEAKIENSHLKEIETKLTKQIKTEEEKLKYYKEKLHLFSYDKDFFNKKINNLSKNLTINEIKFSQENKNFIHYNYVSLSLNGNFKDLLNFIQNLENLPIALKIDKIKLYNTQGLKLKYFKHKKERYWEVTKQEIQKLDTNLLGHPKPLFSLSMVELWERFAFYGIRSLLVLFMATTISKGGLGISTEYASAIYGIFAGCLYLAALPGGWITDNYLGQKNALFLGSFIIALGHISIALSILSTPIFFLGLLLSLLVLDFLKLALL